MCFDFAEGAEWCLSASYEWRRGDLFVRSWARARHLLWGVLFLMRVP